MWGYSFTTWIPDTVVGTVLRLQEWMRVIFPLTAATCDGWDCNDALIHFVFHFVCFLQLSLCGSWPGASLENMPQTPVSVSRFHEIVLWWLFCFGPGELLENYYTLINQNTWWFLCWVGQVSAQELSPLCSYVAPQTASCDAHVFRFVLLHLSQTFVAVYYYCYWLFIYKHSQLFGQLDMHKFHLRIHGFKGIVRHFLKLK